MVGVGGLRKPSGCGDPTCFVTPATNLDNVGGISQCDPEYVKVGNNKYYSPNGNASMNCGGTALSIPEVHPIVAPPPTPTRSVSYFYLLSTPSAFLLPPLPLCVSRCIYRPLLYLPTCLLINVSKCAPARCLVCPNAASPCTPHTFIPLCLTLTGAKAARD